MLLARSPNLAAYWRGKYFVVEDFLTRRRISALPVVCELLHQFSTPRRVEDVVRNSPYAPGSVAREVNHLVRLGFLVPVAKGEKLRDVAGDWQDSFSAAYYHFSRRDYRPNFEEVDWLSTSKPLKKRPPLFKEYPGAPERKLPKVTPSPRPLLLQAVLTQRRTINRHSRRPVPLADFAAVVTGTFGMTGWVDAGVLGKLLKKTTPSVGARHPIECYTLAWNVEGLLPGLYHYNVRKNSLERLKRGNFHTAARAMTGGQKPFGQCAFICVLTAVAPRMFYGYRNSDAYRNLYFDVGHLAQTFQLLATERGLGPCETGALQEGRIEKFLGLDGISEFPLFIVGGGIPERRPKT